MSPAAQHATSPSVPASAPAARGKAEDAPTRFTEGAVRAEAVVVDFGKRGRMATGICFLDHMIDQLTSHGQLGVTVRVALNNVSAEPEWVAPHVDYAGNALSERPHDAGIFAASGAALGAALRNLREAAVLRTAAAEATDEDAGAEPPQKKRRAALPKAPAAKSTFCCPLDEGLAESVIDLLPDSPGLEFALAPYGTMPAGGRRWIGSYRCEHTQLFWERLAEQLQCKLSLRKVRGNNAHHIIESTFKAFARSFRAALDMLSDPDGHSHGCVAPDERRSARLRALSPAPPSAVARQASLSRSTKETAIDVTANLDMPPSRENTGITTGLHVLDTILTELRKSSGFDFTVSCRGDTYIDDHHTAEDISISLGQCFNVALADKAGVCRMACAEGVSGAAHVRVTIDLSNRPHFEHNLPLDEEYVGGDSAAEEAMRSGGHGKHAVSGVVLSCEMLHHVFESLSVETRATVHVELVRDGAANSAGHTLDLSLAMARAFGEAIGECARVDERRAGKVASSKGTLSL